MIDGEDIEGQTPIDDVSGLRVRARSRAELNSIEALNIGKAYLKYLVRRPAQKLAPFSYEWLLQLHAEMLGDVWAWAGTIRARETNHGALPHEIVTQLHEMLEDLRAWERSSMPLDEQAVRLHHRAVKIHPFPNGNGRWSRLLANIWLRLHEHAITQWPEDTIGLASVIRDEYLAAVRSADRGNYAALLALHRAHAVR